MQVRLAGESVETLAGAKPKRSGLDLSMRDRLRCQRDDSRHPVTRRGKVKMILSAAVGMGAVSLCSQFAKATIYTWANAGTDWATPSDWMPGSGYPGSVAGTDLAFFNTAETFQPNVATALSIGEIEFGGVSGYDITSSAPTDTLTLSAATAVDGTNTSGINTVAAPLVFNVASQGIVQATGGTLVLSGALSGTSKLTTALFFNGGTGITEQTSNLIQVTGTSNNLDVPILIGNAGAGAVVSVTALGTTTTNGSLGEGNITLGFTGGGTEYSGLNYTGAGETSNKAFEFLTGSAAVSHGIDTTGASGALILDGAFSTVDSATTALQTVQLTSADNYGDTIASAISDGPDGKVAIEKLGVGQWILSGTNTYTGTTQSGEGTLTLNFVNQTAATSVLKSTGTLTLGQPLVATSDTLALQGAPGVANNQTVGGVSVTTGASHIVLTAGASGGMALTVGALSAGSFGGTVDIAPGANTSVTVGTASNAATGIFVLPIIFDGNTFATNGGSATNPVSGFNSYTSPTTISANFATPVDVMGNISVTGVVIGSAIRFNQAASDTITIANTKSLALGDSNNSSAAVLVTSNVGPNLSTITGGTLFSNLSSGGTGLTLSLIQNNTAGGLEIDSAITGGEALSKAGQGSVVLTGSDTYTKPTFVNEGTLTINNTINSSAALSGTTSVSVAAGATLQLISSTAGVGGVVNLINDNAVLAVSSGASVVLNLQGSTENVFQFTVNGVLQPPGVYSQTTAPAGYASDESYFTSTLPGDSISVAVPEPTSIGLLGSAICLLGRRRRGTRRCEC